MTMTKSFDKGKDEIAKLCKYFATNRDAFLAPGVKESHVRQSLIDPMFEALGWDMRNEARTAPQYREVIPEDSLDVEGHQKAPDYTFRVGQTPKFYAEAKKCGVNINTDPAPAYQLRRYGWSGKVPVSILTDFEELGVYECTKRPQPSHKASHGRILYLGFEEYPDRWRELWDVFSREAVWSGAFDQYAASKRKRGTSEVDEEFLKEIDGWRDALAKNIALRNHDLSSDDLNAAVQKTIDRIVFLRMAEDRGLEPYESLLSLCERPDIYPRFMREACRKADERYNSGLFHFQKEKEVTEPPDRITPGLTVDDKVIKPIIQSLYFAHGSPYHFGVLPVEILGTVYERFLGKVIRLTAGHRAKVEEKPEVRKAGGVYYTPAYIVDYIVEHTVGKQIEGKSPAQLAGGKTKPPFRVLDMACGSGSFLLGAYQYLMDHCLNWYQEHNPARRKKAVYKSPTDDQWRLTIEEKKRILTTHVFGVDIDPQAVEVSKLSLLLKALEGESDATLSHQMALFHDRALPNLSNNIKCGNSLIGPDHLPPGLLPEDDELRRINPFDWKAAFPEPMKAGGFDCVIGNPPYIRIQTMKEWAATEVELLKQLYRSAHQGNYDIYVVFLERGLQLLNATGLLGYICPHKFFNARYGESIRSVIAEGHHLLHVVHFGAEQVFEGATTYTCLVFLGSSPTPKCRFVQVEDPVSWATTAEAEDGLVAAEDVTSAAWSFHVGPGSDLMRKLTAIPQTLGEVATRIFQGFKTGADPVFILDITPDGSFASKSLGADVDLESEYLRPLCKSGQFKRYHLHPAERVIIFPYKDGRLQSWKEIKSNAPKTAEYLCACRELLAAREKGRWAGNDWYCYSRTQALSIMSSPKILTADLNPFANYCLDETGDVCFTGGAAGGYGILLSDSLRLPVLALLNSRLLDWYLKSISSTFRGGWYSFESRFISRLPMPPDLSASSPKHKSGEELSDLARTMLSLNGELALASTAKRKELLIYRIHALDAKINRLVYELYGLTEKEIRIVEGANSADE